MAEARKAVEGQLVACKLNLCTDFSQLFITAPLDDQPLLPPAAGPILKCRVMLRKENDYGPPIDEECGDPVDRGHAGLCL